MFITVRALTVSSAGNRTLRVMKNQFTLSREEIERIIAPYVGRRITTTSTEWRDLVAHEADLRRLRYFYWRQRLFGWLRSRQSRGQFVEKTYDRIWSQSDFAEDFDPARNRMPLQWNEQGFVASAAVTHRLHLALLIKAIRALRPRTVLEVGSGRGLNLLVLSCALPETKFKGLELTESGTAVSRAQVAAPRLSEALVKFMPEPLIDPMAYRRIEFERGSAERIPYHDASFDLVFTRLALEQMEAIRTRALAEIARVARNHVILIESFREMNDTGLRRTYAIGRDYFRGSIAELQHYGLEATTVFADWPHKVTLQPVFVVTRRVGNGTKNPPRTRDNAENSGAAS